jgi:hypothetical protein
MCLRYYTLLFAFLLAASEASSQASETEEGFLYRNAFHFEIGYGPTLGGSCERVLLNNHVFKSSMQLGVTVYRPGSESEQVWVPMLLNYYMSALNNHFEIGLGHVFLDDAVRSGPANILRIFPFGKLCARLGYRYQNSRKRFIFRVALMPLIDYKPVTARVDFYGHISVGTAFGKK